MKGLGFMSDEATIAELIKRRRRQVWVHSIIYYKMDTNLIDDSTWSKWAEELEELQRQYPDISDSAEFADVFKGFEHSTGSTLPLDDPEMNRIAQRLIDICS